MIMGLIRLNILYIVMCCVLLICTYKGELISVLLINIKVLVFFPYPKPVIL